MNIERRIFLTGTGLAMLGGVLYATRTPEIVFETHTCLESAKDKGRILVAYTSQYGSTAGVAAAIARNFCHHGIPADALPATNTLDLAPYRALIMGAPVISEEWMPEAVEFLAHNEKRLQGIPVAYFLTCMTLALHDTPENRVLMAGVLERVKNSVPSIQPMQKAVFAGAVDYGKMSLFMRTMYRYFSEDDTAGDFRNWDAIRAWSTTLEAGFPPRPLDLGA